MSIIFRSQSPIHQPSGRPQPIYPHPLSQDLVARYLMNHAGGTATIYDSSQNRRHTTTTVLSATALVGGVFGGRSLYFNGTDDGMVSYLGHQIGTGDFTVAAWVYPTNLAASQFRTVCAFDTFAPGFYVRMGSEANWGIYWSGSTYASGNTLTTNRWYHLVWQRQGSTIQFFQNATPTPTTHTDSSSINDGQLRIAYGGTNYIGNIQDLCVWRRALTQNEINSLYSLPYSGYSRLADILLDALAASGSLVRIANETENVSDALARRFYSVRLANATENITESQNRRFRSIRVIDTTVNLTEALVNRMRSVRLANATVNIIETVVNRMRSVRLVSTTQNISESLGHIFGRIQVAADTINITETLSRVAGFVQVANETVNIAFDAVRRQVMVRLMNVSESISDIPLRRLRSLRQLASTVNLSEIGVHLNRFVKIASSTINIAEGLVRKTTEVVVGVSTIVINLVGRFRATTTLSGKFEATLTRFGKFMSTVIKRGRL